MKSMKKAGMLTAIALFAVTGVFSQAALVNGQNWADTVISYTSGIQNYGGTLMDSTAAFWVLGPSDADQTGNMYAGDIDDLDYVAGWRGKPGGEAIVVGFNTAITDAVGDDIVIRLYCGPNAGANVSVSADNINWTSIGSIAGSANSIPGTPGCLYDAAFDLNGLFTGNVHYIKVSQTASGPQTGLFFDSFASVPEPATLLILGIGGAFLRKRS